MQTQRWAQENYGQTKLGDGRRTRRLVQVMAAAAAHPSGRISQVFARACDRQAAYDFVEHDSVSCDAVIGAVGDACARTFGAHERVFFILDGTSLTLKDAQLSKGFGYVGTIEAGTQGFKVLNTLALTPQGEVLGVPTQRYWVRSGRVERRKGRPAHERESLHWRYAVREVAERRDRLAPATTLHCIGDREADASPLIRDLLENGHEFTIRANGTRNIKLGKQRLALRPWLIRQPVVARLVARLPSETAGSERDVTLMLRAARVPMVLRDRHTKRRVTRELTVVWAREPGRMATGQRRVEWMIYTSDVAVNSAQACAVVQRYSLRWRIEDMHRTWKSGACNVETMQLRSASAAIKWACMLGAVAARIERLKTLSRSDPSQLATVELADIEIRALLILKRKYAKRGEVIADEPPTIAQAVRWIADLGGYVGNKSSGPPGSTVLARGLERLTMAAELLEALGEAGILKMR
jgi:hypothetical protein